MFTLTPCGMVSVVARPVPTRPPEESGCIFLCLPPKQLQAAMNSSPSFPDADQAQPSASMPCACTRLAWAACPVPGMPELAEALQMSKRSPGFPCARTAWKAAPAPLPEHALGPMGHVSSFSIKTQEFAEFQEASTSLCQPMSCLWCTVAL